MKLDLPVYCEKQPGERGAPATYVVRPLFFLEPEQRRDDLPRAMTALAAKLRDMALESSRGQWHEPLAELAFAPPLSESRVEVSIEHRKRSRKLTFFLVSFKVGEQKLCMTPKLPDLFIAVARGETAEQRAAEVLARYFRNLERDSEDSPDPAEFALNGQAWLSSLELRVDTDLLFKPPEQQRQAARGEFQVKGGLEELQRVGRCLDALCPDEISRAVQREQEVSELARALDSEEHRPVLLVGAPGSGKSAIVQEYVARSCEARRLGRVSQFGVWLLNPQRLISGMSVVGQWENRLHAILTAARERKLVLYFDDLVGLFKAGQTSQSRLSVAHVLKPFMERREFRVLGEITPEQLRVLQELDRSFADLFHVIHVQEPHEEGNLAILIEVMRGLEARHGCRFDTTVIPAVVELQTRYVRDRSFPGKGAGFLRQLAQRHRNAAISRREVLDEFKAVSGLSVEFLDERVKLSRDGVLRALQDEVAGQDHALALLADTVALAKARLNDPGRPLGSFLFLGPTGVGKTQTAKAIARYLFGDAGRLLRFDMNEFASPYAVSRLAGTFREPEGLLTSAVRRQPFGVILFDEIEKCHPDAYDLLLQVLGEARLTDGLGRTADFANCLIILTSNLGVREAGGGLGFSGHDDKDAPAYIKAAERFFRPEFFNRLDHVVPFGRLPRLETRRIVRQLLSSLVAREGLGRRKCVLRVPPPALDRVARQGYHPALGARALKRALEREITQPLARTVARLKGHSPTLLTLAPGQDSLQVLARPLLSAAPRDESLAALGELDAAEAHELVDDALEQARLTMEKLRPREAISGARIEQSHRAYFAIKAQAEKLRKLAERLGRHSREDSSRIGRSSRMARHTRRHRERMEYAGQRAWRDFCSIEDVREFLVQSREEGQESEGQPSGAIRNLLGETALLQLLMRSAPRQEGRVVLLFESLNAALPPQSARLAAQEAEVLREAFELAVRELDVRGLSHAKALLVEGTLARELAPLETGTHLFIVEGELAPVAVTALPLKARQRPEAVLNRLRLARKRWWTEGGEEPYAPGPVLRVIHQSGQTLDLRSGGITRSEAGVGARRSYLLSALPLGHGEEE